MKREARGVVEFQGRRHPSPPVPSPLPGARGAMRDFQCSTKHKFLPSPPERGRGVGGEGASPPAICFQTTTLTPAVLSCAMPHAKTRSREGIALAQLRIIRRPLAFCLGHLSSLTLGRARLLPSPLSAQTPCGSAGASPSQRVPQSCCHSDWRHAATFREVREMRTRPSRSRLVVDRVGRAA